MIRFKPKRVGRPRSQTLGWRIRELREEQGLSQDALGRASWLPTVSISKLELWGEDINPTLRTVVGISEALGVSIDMLVRGLSFEKKSKF